MLLFSVFLILIIIGCLGGIYYIITYNRLNEIINKTKEAEAIIDDDLRRKYDTLTRISNTLKKQMKSNKNYFKEYEKLNDMKISNFEMDRKLNEAFTLILKMQEDLNLEKDEDLNKEIEKVKRLDEKLCATKNYYNKNTSLENAMIRQFPTNVIAKIHKFKIRLFFDGKDMDDEIIDDFKI